MVHSLEPASSCIRVTQIDHGHMCMFPPLSQWPELLKLTHITIFIGFFTFGERPATAGNCLELMGPIPFCKSCLGKGCLIEETSVWTRADLGQLIETEALEQMPLMAAEQEPVYATWCTAQPLLSSSAGQWTGGRGLDLAALRFWFSSSALMDRSKLAV